MVSQQLRLNIANRQAITGLDEDMVVRDLMQTRILAAMFDTATRNEIALKGGLALRAHYQSERYTKDIDLQTGSETPMARVKSIVESAIKSAVDMGIIENVSITAPKQTSVVQRFKVGGTIVGGGSLVNLTVEVSRRGMPPPNLISAIAYAPDPEFGKKAVVINVYSPEAIAAAKVDCLLNPNRAAPRDVFDLALLIKMEVYPPVEVLRMRGKDALAEGMKEVWRKLEIMPWAVAKEELLPYMSTEHNILDEKAWNDMVLDVGEAVERWLEEAHDAEISAGPMP